MNAVGSLLYVPLVIWVATGVGLLVAYRRSTPTVVLRLAAAFLALWAVLATTVLVWVLYHGGWPAVVALLHSPLLLFQSRWLGFWAAGAFGALALLSLAFVLSQVAARGLLQMLHTAPIPGATLATRGRGAATTVLAFESDRPEAFSFTLLEPGLPEGRAPYRHDFILVSSGLRERLRPEELEAVIAHELGHVRGLDSRYLTFLRTFSRMMRWDPLLAYLAQSLTRREEFRADLDAVRLTHHPRALARALYKAIAAGGSASGAPVPSFLGLPGKRGSRDALDRIRRLVALADSGAFEGEPVD